MNRSGSGHRKISSIVLVIMMGLSAFSCVLLGRDAERSTDPTHVSPAQSQRWEDVASNGPFNRPVAVATDATGNVYVLDAHLGRVVKLSADLRVVADWGPEGSGPARFRTPVGLAVDPAGNVVTIVNYPSAAYKLSSNGTPLGSWSWSDQGQLGHLTPYAIAAGGDGSAFVGGSSGRPIFRISPSGDLTVWSSALYQGRRSHEILALAVDRDGSVYASVATMGGAGLALPPWSPSIVKLSPDGVIEAEFALPQTLAQHNGLAVDDAGMIYVSRTSPAGLIVMSSDGRILTEIGSAGPNDDQLARPLGLALAGDRSIYVADSWNYRVLRLATDGRLLGSWGAAPYFDCPHAVAVDGRGDLYVSNLGPDCLFATRYRTVTQRIVKVSANGGIVRQFGPHVRSRGVALASDGGLYASDDQENRVVKLDAGGTIETTWGSIGSGPGQFNRPAGLALDEASHVLVADERNNRVQLFTSDGQFYRTFGDKGEDPGRLNQPVAIAVANDGSIYVGDNVSVERGETARIQRLSGAGKYVGESKLRAAPRDSDRARWPVSGIAVATDGRVWAAFTLGPFLMDFSSDLGPGSRWGDYASASGPGTLAGRFIVQNGPRGLAFDTSSNLILTVGDNRLVRLRLNGAP